MRAPLGGPGPRGVEGGHRLGERGLETGQLALEALDRRGVGQGEGVDLAQVLEDVLHGVEGIGCEGTRCPGIGCEGTRSPGCTSLGCTWVICFTFFYLHGTYCTMRV